ETATITVTTKTSAGVPLGGATVYAIIDGDTAHPMAQGTDGNAHTLFANLEKGAKVQFYSSKAHYMTSPVKNVSVSGDDSIELKLTPLVNVPVHVSNPYRGYLNGAHIYGSGVDTYAWGGQAVLYDLVPGAYMGVWVVQPGYDTKLVYFYATGGLVDVFL